MNPTIPSSRTTPPETSRLWLYVASAALLLLCFDVRPAHAVAITLGSRIDLSPTTFALPIEITDAIGVSEWFLDLTYDPTDVQVNVNCDPFSGDIYCSLFTGPVTEGDFFAAGAPFNLLVPGFVELDPITFMQSGRLFGMHGAFGGIPPAPSGSGVLAYVQFLILGAGDSPIEPDGEVVSEPTPVPEPGPLALLAAGLAWLGGRWLYPRSCRARSVGALAWLGGLAAVLAPGTSRRASAEKNQRFRENPMNTFLTFRLPFLACVALASLVIGERAFAQALPPAIDIPPNLPTVMPAPIAPYPPTVAPTAAAPYFVPPAWSQTLPSQVRFVILSNFDNDAVLDRETGLVWTRRTVANSVIPASAERTCSQLILKNRMGWRLPTVIELQSLLDASVPESSEPRLPVGHPFLLLPNLPGQVFENHDYWAMDTTPGPLVGLNGFPLLRWSVHLDDGSAGVTPQDPFEVPPQISRSAVLCVRGNRVTTEIY